MLTGKKSNIWLSFGIILAFIPFSVEAQNSQLNAMLFNQLWSGTQAITVSSNSSVTLECVGGSNTITAASCDIYLSDPPYNPAPEIDTVVTTSNQPACDFIYENGQWTGYSKQEGYITCPITITQGSSSPVSRLSVISTTPPPTKQ